jgi:hypothetical protein
MENSLGDDIGTVSLAAARFKSGGTARSLACLFIAFVLWPVSAFAQAEQLTLKSWTACPTIEATNEMLVFDGYSAVCEPVKANSRMIVERSEQAPATRWMCIDHPAASGTFTFCNWQTFQDERKTWLCARSPSALQPCKWGPAEYFTGEPILAEVP